MKRIITGLAVFVVVVSALIYQRVSASSQNSFESPFYSDNGPVPGFLASFPVEKVTGVLTAKKMEIVVFPLNMDYFYQYFTYNKGPSVVRTYELNDVEMGYKNLYMVPDPKNPGNYMRYTVFYHTEGSPLVAIGVYDRGILQRNGIYEPKESYYVNNEKTGVGNPDLEHSVLGDYYPNKIINDLEVATAILDYQAKNGPFVAGKEYSMLEIMDLGRPAYVPGMTGVYVAADGGGVCVMATNMMKILTLSKAKVVEHWSHPTGSKYFETPMGADELPMAATDATVESPKYDLRWVQKETAWIKVTAAVMTSGDSVENDLGGSGMKNDAVEVITMRFVASQPDLSSSRIRELSDAYRAYRRLLVPNTAPLVVGGSRLLEQVTWAAGDEKSLLLTKIVPEERIDRFASELATDPLLKSLVVVRESINSVPNTSDVLIGSKLKNSQWYADVKARLGDVRYLDDALTHLDGYSNYYPGQKVQCYGLAVLISGLDKRFVPIGGYKVANASDLVPKSIRNGETYVSGVVRTIETLGEVMVGDFGLRYDTEAGHVFAIVGKKLVDGKVVLLAASANQRGDGKIAIFEIDDSNFEAVFGIPNYRKVVLGVR